MLLYNAKKTVRTFFPLLAVSACSVGMLGQCTSDSEPEVISINRQTSSCGGFTTLAKHLGARLIPEDTALCLEETLFWRYDPVSRVLTLVQRHVSDNCAAQLTMEVVKNGDVLVLQKKDLRNPNVTANCVCSFDLYCEVPEVSGTEVTLALDTFLLELDLNEKNGKIVIEPLVRLELNEYRFSDLSVVSAYPGLRYLTSVDAQQYTDLSPIGRLSNLTYLECYNIDSVGFVETCTKLEYLRLSATSVLNDISPIAYLGNLLFIGISNAASLVDISAVAQCRNLSSLWLTDCPGVTDFSPVSSCALLTDLKLDGCGGLADLAFLTGLGGLSSVVLSNVPAVTSLEPLANHAELADLTLDSLPGVTALEPLRSLTNLHTLRINGNALITDISPLAACTSLVTVNFDNLSSVTDFSPLLACLGEGDVFTYIGVSVPRDILDSLTKKGVLHKGRPMR